MKKLTIIPGIILLNLNLYAQDYLFRNLKLPENERINNLISLMTPDEKISCLSTRLALPVGSAHQILNWRAA